VLLGRYSGVLDVCYLIGKVFCVVARVLLGRYYGVLGGC